MLSSPCQIDNINDPIHMTTLAEATDLLTAEILSRFGLDSALSEVELYNVTHHPAAGSWITWACFRAAAHTPAGEWLMPHYGAILCRQRSDEKTRITIYQPMPRK